MNAIVKSIFQPPKQKSINLKSHYQYMFTLPDLPVSNILKIGPSDGFFTEIAGTKLVLFTVWLDIVN